LATLKSGDLDFSFWILANLGQFFSMKNPLHKLRSHFSGRNLVKICQVKEALHWVKALWRGYL
jgi:hypothetical protein